MSKQVSEERKAAYYIGALLMVIGFLVFASIFVSVATSDGGFGTDGGSMMARALIGMGLMAAGGFIRTLGARGLAGSGTILDPEQAREDLEPYSRMAGGMVKDALDEAGVKLSGDEPEKVIMIKCPKCAHLNEDGSKFCQECGEGL